MFTPKVCCSKAAARQKNKQATACPAHTCSKPVVGVVCALNDLQHSSRVGWQCKRPCIRNGAFQIAHGTSSMVDHLRMDCTGPKISSLAMVMSSVTLENTVG